MDQRKITCVCGQKFAEEEFQRHFSSCQPFKSQFKEFDSKFGELLKSYSEPKERLLIVKFLLKQYINVIDKKLKKYYSNLAQNPAPIINDGNVAPPMGPSGMGNDLKMNKNQQSELFKNNIPFMGQNQGNPFAQNQSQGNPFAQNQNQGNPFAQNQNQGNPYVQSQSQNQGNPYAQSQNQGNPFAQNQNQGNPYVQNQNQGNPYVQNQNKNQDNSFIPNQSSNPFAQQDDKNKNNEVNDDFKDDFNSQPIQQDDNIGTMCQRCKVNPDVGYLACVHPICANCFIKYAEQEFYNMKCNICNKEIDDQTKKMILGEQKFNQLEKR